MANMRQSTQSWIATVTVIASLTTFILLSYVVPEFEKLFEGFGAELPAFTRLVITVHNYYYLLAIPGVAGNILIHLKKQTAGWVLVVFSGAMGVILIPFTVIAMYLPIFQMGRVVGG